MSELHHMPVTVSEVVGLLLFFLFLLLGYELLSDDEILPYCYNSRQSNEDNSDDDDLDMIRITHDHLLTRVLEIIFILS